MRPFHLHSLGRNGDRLLRDPLEPHRNNFARTEQSCQGEVKQAFVLGGCQCLDLANYDWQLFPVGRGHVMNLRHWKDFRNFRERIRLKETRINREVKNFPDTHQKALDG